MAEMRAKKIYEIQNFTRKGSSYRKLDVGKYAGLSDEEFAKRVIRDLIREYKIPTNKSFFLRKDAYGVVDIMFYIWFNPEAWNWFPTILVETLAKQTDFVFPSAQGLEHAFVFHGNHTESIHTDIRRFHKTTIDREYTEETLRKMAEDSANFTKEYTEYVEKNLTRVEDLAVFLEPLYAKYNFSSEDK